MSSCSWRVASVTLIGLLATQAAWGESPEKSRHSTTRPRAAAVSEQPGTLLAKVAQQQRLATEMICTEVEAELRHAHSQLATHPATVEQDLKLMVERVKLAPDILPGVQAQLCSILETAAREAHRRAAEKQVTDMRSQQAKAAARERQNALGSSDRDQELMKQQAARYQGLIDSGKYEKGRGAVAENKLAEAHESLIGASAPLVAQAMAGRADNQALRATRRDALMNTFAAVEKSANPTPDDQPIVYQDAQSWRELTERRRRLIHVDMKKLTPAETKIQTALNQTAAFDFDQTTLADVADYLSDLYGITVKIDEQALKDADIPTDTMVTQKLKGISLRSALHLTLRPMDLTTMMKDEVLMITTRVVASQEVVRKVYPVDDLVLPRDPRDIR